MLVKGRRDLWRKGVGEEFKIT